MSIDVKYIDNILEKNLNYQVILIYLFHKTN